MNDSPVFPIKRILLEHGDHRARQTADVQHDTTAADLLRRVEVKTDGRHLVLHKSGEAFDLDMPVYEHVESGQVVQVVRHPEHQRTGPLPFVPTVGSHD